VTAVLKNLLDNGLIDDEVTSAVGSVMVTALAPDLISLEKTSTSQLNLFLYQVTPNQGWRNVGLPSHDAQGERRSNPPLALDLHYLITAYGSKDLHAEILLGYALQILHEVPVLPRAAIRRALGVSGLVEDPGNALPAELEALGASGLAEQVETIKITPEEFGTEELSKLWSAFQSRYRPSAAYHASVVLIESERSTRVPLPVRDRRLHVVPFREPVIDRLLREETVGGASSSGPILARHRLVIRGRRLRGQNTVVRISGVAVTPAATDLTDTQVIVPIPATLSASIHTVQVVHEHLMGEPPVPHMGVASNLAAFVLHPEVISVTVPVLSPSTRVRVVFEPPVQPTQRVVLVLNELMPAGSPMGEERPRAYSFVAPSRVTTSPSGPETLIEVPIAGVTPGTYLVRVTVDGAQSPLATDAAGAYTSPSITLP
jgi:hypothetical protein